jgi:pyruvate,water dikinase
MGLAMLDGLKELLTFRPGRKRDLTYSVLFKKFKSILERNNRILELMADMGDKMGGEYVFDSQYLISAVEVISDLVFKMISDYSVLTEKKNRELFVVFDEIQRHLQEELAGRHDFAGGSLTLPLLESGQDMQELSGLKMAVLAEMNDKLHLPVPDGFVITTKAYFDFMRHNNVDSMVEKGIAGWNRRDETYLKNLSEKVMKKIEGGEIPRAITSQIDARMDVLQQKFPNKRIRVAARSSAWGEDGEISFAGQYESVLNVTRRKLYHAYKTVVASTYAYDVWRYRLDRDFREHEVAMAVGCQIMADATVSGVLHTYSEENNQAVMLVNATWGLGLPLVGGETGGDSFILSRTPPYDVCQTILGNKPRRLVCAEEEGTAWEDVPEGLTKEPCLSVDRLVSLAEIAMTIERYFKRPQEIEWTVKENGELAVLQARPLRLRQARQTDEVAVDDAMRNAEVIFSGRGMIAQRGVAVGPVHIVDSDETLDNFPHGAILVAKFTTPRYSRVMNRTSGIITDVGSPAGHMANIAREYRVPTLVNTEIGTRLLKQGDVITLDATQNVVYRGRISELDRYELTEEVVFEETYEYRLLRSLLKRITPLNLVDPHGLNFKPEACRTYHDITRYIHEKAVEELIRVSEKYSSKYFATPYRLMSGLPLGLNMIDAGGGVKGTGNTKLVTADRIECLPLKELITGIHSSGLWCTEPVSVDMGSLMSSITRTFSSSMPGMQKVGRNLAVIFKEYMNMHLHLGYHFTVIDAYISEMLNDNYIYFRFVGGVTDNIRRSRRARFIREVLERYDFRVELHGDLVVGRLKKLTLDRMALRMRMIGGLIGYTRQLDVRMNDDSQIGQHMDAFFKAMDGLLAEEDGNENERGEHGQ